MKNPKVILITGASSGLGAELAIQYAKPGVTLLLTARNIERLEPIMDRCRAQGANVEFKIIDVCDEAALEDWICTMDTQFTIDTVIANAGISAGSGQFGEDESQVKRIFHTNVLGLMHTIHPLIPRMQQRKRGQIGIISSLSGYRGLPSAPAYSASKAAVKVYGEALRGWLSKDNVGVTVITPGYIKTPMTDVNEFPMPFLVPVEKAATTIIKGLACNKSRLAFPYPLYMIIWFLSSLPPAWTDWIFRSLPSKNTDTTASPKDKQHSL
ncbi:MAG: SDR family NAD(P)-dependent oxidoreductase [Alphaproteobacteria bacterium]|nr:SDR family NAD(P)-dependent oxidoreductase [Alphaproteobacteria bacterium]